MWHELENGSKIYIDPDYLYNHWYFEKFVEIMKLKEQVSSSAGRFHAMPAETKNYQSLWQLPTLCCQKVYYDSGLQQLLAQGCSTRRTGQTDLCKWKARSAVGSHIIILCIFVSFEKHGFPCVVFIMIFVHRLYEAIRPIYSTLLTPPLVWKQ